MKTTIKTYQDLLDEKVRLEALLIEQKQVLRNDFQEIKTQLAPVQKAMNWVGKLVTRDTHNWVLNAGANTVIDMILKRFVLARAGWFTKFVVPFFVKNFTSHVIEEKKMGFLSKLFSWIGRKNANGKEQPIATEEHPLNGKIRPEDSPEG
jgi:hypothetical protein